MGSFTNMGGYKALLKEEEALMKVLQQSFAEKLLSGGISDNNPTTKPHY